MTQKKKKHPKRIKIKRQEPGSPPATGVNLLDVNVKKAKQDVKSPKKPGATTRRKKTPHSRIVIKNIKRPHPSKIKIKKKSEILRDMQEDEIYVKPSERETEKTPILEEEQEPMISKTFSEKLKSKPFTKIVIHKPMATATESQPTTRFNEKFIDVLEQLSALMTKKGEAMRAMAYKNAAEKLMLIDEDLNSVDQLKGMKGVGKAITDKFQEFMDTGKVNALEKVKADPMISLTNIYGIGPAKAKELVAKGITSVEDLKSADPSLLNDKQRLGLKYYDDIEQRIPREIIDQYENAFQIVFNEVAPAGSALQIVGSYRRGARSSGDIDIIITNDNGDKSAYKNYLKALKERDIIKVFLSEGNVKSLTIAQLPGDIARRVDFMWSPPNEAAFAILYFTGSKYFNVAMREEAVKQGYSLNEHGFTKLVKGTKTQKLEKEFLTEESIFDFLGLKFKTPEERKGIRSVEKVDVVVSEDTPAVVKKPITITAEQKEKMKRMKKTLKKKTLSPGANPSQQNIKEFQKKGIDALNALSQKDLEEMVTEADNAYHGEKSAPLMSDAEYDILKDTIQSRYPKSKASTSIGAPVTKNKVSLPYPMPSMDKIKPDTGALEKWMKTYTGPYVLSAKLDGVSGLYSTENGEAKLYTRGDGKVGQDISHLIPFLRLPTTPNITIRLEFVVPKDTFQQKYADTFSNARNMVAGIVNQKKIEPEKLADLHCVAYEVMTPVLTPSDQMKFLALENVEVVLHQFSDTLTNEQLSELLVQWRQAYTYEIDGVIAVDDKIYPRKGGNPEHAFAFKMVLSDQVAEAHVVDVIWTASKDGYLKPRIRIQPVVLGGAKIEYATAFNAAFVADNKLGIGAIVQLVRSGDVIPHIMAVITPAAQAKMPDQPYVWNESHVDVILENIDEDKIVQEKNIITFFKTLDVEGLGPGNIVKMMAAGFDTVPKILSMSIGDYQTVEGFKQKKSEKIYNSVQEKIQAASLPQIMVASNVFGRAIGIKRIQAVLELYPDIITSDVPSDEKISMVTNVPGIAAKTARVFVEKLPKFAEFMRKANLENKLHEVPESVAVDTSGPLYGKTIVFTGVRDKDYMKTLESQGAKIGSTISKKTDYVIVKDLDETTSKADEARKMNIPIYQLDDFKTMHTQ